jgi:hypothetical protein
MNAKRIAMLSAAGAVLAAMIAGATTSGPRRAPPPPVAPNTAAIELQGAELAAEVARLRARLRPTTEPQDPARNLFQFGARAARPADVIASPAPAPEPAAMPPAFVPPPFTLVGVAADAGPEGPIRTAILSGFGDLFMVREGEAVTPNYKVARIDAEGVELIHLIDATTLRLTLK